MDTIHSTTSSGSPTRNKDDITSKGAQVPEGRKVGPGQTSVLPHGKVFLPQPQDSEDLMRVEGIHPDNVYKRVTERAGITDINALYSPHLTPDQIGEILNIGQEHVHFMQTRHTRVNEEIINEIFGGSHSMDQTMLLAIKEAGLATPELRAKQLAGYKAGSKHYFLRLIPTATIQQLATIITYFEDKKGESEEEKGKLSISFGAAILGLTVFSVGVAAIQYPLNMSSMDRSNPFGPQIAGAGSLLSAKSLGANINASKDLVREPEDVEGNNTKTLLKKCQMQSMQFLKHRALKVPYGVGGSATGAISMLKWALVGASGFVAWQTGKPGFGSAMQTSAAVACLAATGAVASWEKVIEQKMAYKCLIQFRQQEDQRLSQHETQEETQARRNKEVLAWTKIPENTGIGVAEKIFARHLKNDVTTLMDKLKFSHEDFMDYLDLNQRQVLRTRQTKLDALDQVTQTEVVAQEAELSTLRQTPTDQLTMDIMSNLARLQDEIAQKLGMSKEDYTVCISQMDKDGIFAQFGDDENDRLDNFKNRINAQEARFRSTGDDTFTTIKTALRHMTVTSVETIEQMLTDVQTTHRDISIVGNKGADGGRYDLVSGTKDHQKRLLDAVNLDNEFGRLKMAKGMLFMMMAELAPSYFSNTVDSLRTNAGPDSRLVFEQWGMRLQEGGEVASNVSRMMQQLFQLGLGGTIGSVLFSAEVITPIADFLAAKHPKDSEDPYTEPTTMHYATLITVGTLLLVGALSSLATMSQDHVKVLNDKPIPLGLWKQMYTLNKFAGQLGSGGAGLYIVNALMTRSALGDMSGTAGFAIGLILGCSEILTVPINGFNAYFRVPHAERELEAKITTLKAAVDAAENNRQQMSITEGED